MQKLVAYFAGRSLLVNIFSIGVGIAGVLYLFSAKREAFPSVAFDWVLVSTIYPGATAADVEKHITIPIEDELREVDGIDELYVTSQEAISTVAIKLDPDLKNKDKVITDIKNAVDRAKDLPTDAEKPAVTELELGMMPILEIALRKKDGVNGDADEFELRRYAKILNDRLLRVDGVARVEKQGYRDREMIVEVDPQKLQAYQVAINLIVHQLQRKNVDFPGGIIKSAEGDILIRTVGELTSPAEIARVPVQANVAGNYMRIGDVATVRDSFEERTMFNRNHGRPAIMLTVVKKESADIISLADRLKAEIESFRKGLPDRYEMSTYNDVSFYVRRRLDVLLNNGIAGFFLVIACLFLALGWRISLVTALGLPLAMMATFVWMGQAGVSINLMSMFGLIMVLGMLVDDAIIVAENIYRHLEAGAPITEAVTNGTAEVLIPVAGTVITTIAAFTPLMFLGGIMGRFMWVLPAVVSVALLASWLESMFILPAHVKDIEEHAAHRNGGRVSAREKGSGRVLLLMQARYSRVLDFVLRRRYFFFAGGALFALGTLAFAANFVKLILFPQGGIEVIVINAEAPQGTGLEAMSARMEKIERVIAELPKTELDTFSTRVGMKGASVADPDARLGTNYGTTMVYLTAAQGRKREADAITEQLRSRTKAFSGEFVSLEFSPVRNGPPVGAAVNVSIQGDDRVVIAKIAGEYKAFLRKIEGLKDVKDDHIEGKIEKKVVVDERIAAMAGISVFDVATTIRACYSGAVATTIKKTDEQIDIRVILPESLRRSADSLRDIKVANQTGYLVPLSAISRVETSRGVFALNRKNWRSAVQVTAEIDEKARGVTSVTVNRMLMKQFADVETRHPGATISYEGEFKDTEESIRELMRSFVIAAVAIYVLLVGIFRSLAHPLVVMGVIPLTFLGVVWIFFFHGLPLSFIALMGVVGLSGVVVNDSIVLVDFIKRERQAGVELRQAVVQAGITRLRPVFLTTITTFLGLVPTAYGIGGNDPFLKPMAVALAWGLMFGTVVTLLGTPVLYSIFADVKLRLLRSELR